MNSNFDIADTEFEDVKIITPFYVEDKRGFFLKSFEKDVFKEFNLSVDIYEDFESYSTRNVIRGMHFQTKNPQIKMVRAIEGTIFDVLVDLRKGSKSFGEWKGFELSQENHQALWVPAGFAHGFKVLSDHAIVSYKCIGKYLKGYDSGIVWNDPQIGIEWNTENPNMSERDKQLNTFEKFQNEFGCL